MLAVVVSGLEYITSDINDDAISGQSYFNRYSFKECAINIRGQFEEALREQLPNQDFLPKQVDVLKEATILSVTESEEDSYVYVIGIEYTVKHPVDETFLLIPVDWQFNCDLSMF